jgi:hypothetical protein
MKANEALVFKVYDTDPNVGVKFTAHTAFEDPTGRANAPARQSIEIRALVFF